MCCLPLRELGRRPGGAPLARRLGAAQQMGSRRRRSMGSRRADPLAGGRGLPLEREAAGAIAVEARCPTSYVGRQFGAGDVHRKRKGLLLAPLYFVILVSLLNN